MDGEREGDSRREYLSDDSISPPPMALGLLLSFDIKPLLAVPTTGGRGEDFLVERKRLPLRDELSISISEEMEAGRIWSTEDVRRMTSATRADHFGLGLELLILVIADGGCC